MLLEKMSLVCFVTLVIAILCMGEALSVVIPTTIVENKIDRLALLAFKSEIKLDPQRVMSSWNESLHCCQWEGVTCSPQHKRVTALNLRSRGFVGTLSPHIARLSFLHNLTLSNNILQGPIPPDLGRLFRLQVLDLRNNSLTGEIPATLSHCTNMLTLALGKNNLVGRIPSALASLTKLKVLALHENHLSGGIPPFLSNLTSLEVISIAENPFGGSIPDLFGQLGNLYFLSLGANNLSGLIPPSMYNLSSLQILSLSQNQLHGSLPTDFGLYFPYLQKLTMDQNFFEGSIPTSLSNSSNLEIIQMDDNMFSGQLSVNFGGMQYVQVLTLSNNRLGSDSNTSMEASDMSFFTSLANCSSLQRLSLASNQFKGVLPNSLANFSVQLSHLVISQNEFFGAIPLGIGNLANVILFSLSYNIFTGTIPSDFGMLRNLQVMSLASNRISGNIPPSLGNLSYLSELYLFSNKLQGTIPPSLGQCQYLQALDLSDNSLNGSIPKQIAGIPPLIVLNLSQNHLVGSVPVQIGHLKALSQFYVSRNKLSDEIPNELGGCTNLEDLVMNDNFFKGLIPQSLSSLRGLTNLDLSQNNLSGQIPQFFEIFPYLQNLNLSFNGFEGEVPRKGVFRNRSAISVIGNDKLCGGIDELHLPRCPIQRSKTGERRGSPSLQLIIILILCALLGFALLACSLYCFLHRGRKEQPLKFFIKPKGSSLPQVSYRTLQKASDGFSTSNLIGIGSFGSVYKGTIDEGVRAPVAIKVFNLQRQGALKSFEAECAALKDIRHRNLVKIITTCSGVDSQGNDFKALIYEFMPLGSLEMWLHCSDHKNSKGQNAVVQKLSFLQRMDIAIDIASALDYLHSHCKKTIFHCDLKPSNVLLGSEMTAHVGDFGLVKFAQELTDSNQSSSFGFRGTIGYAAPEYGIGGEPSASGDVYSFGILLLEMMTGKRPTDAIFQGGLNLNSFARSALPNRVREIADPIILLDGNDRDETAEICSNEQRRSSSENGGGGRRMEECVGSMVEVGVVCSAEAPQDRMAMSGAIRELQSIRRAFLGTRVSGSGMGPATVHSHRLLAPVT